MAALRTLVICVGWLLAGGLTSAACAVVSTNSTISTVDVDQASLPPAGWSLKALLGGRPDVMLQVLERPAVALPARYLMVVVPGSGCTGWEPVATRYFAGLLHAELLVLHKPGAKVDAGLAAVCTPDFIQNDTLSAWRDHARAALRAYFSTRFSKNSDHPSLPVLLLGISEGAELLPELAAEVPHLAAMVMISAPGLDPLETGQLQAQRLGQWPAWQVLASLQSSDASDDTVHQGRTLGYWRDFWRWKLTQPLLDAPWPLLRVWGGADVLVPELAYQRFTDQSRSRLAQACHIRLPDADHGLQSSQLDGVQWLWARIEVWARRPANGFCALVLP